MSNIQKLKSVICLAVVMTFANASQCQTMLQKIGWLEGDWCKATNKKTTCEKWELTDENTLSGTSFVVKNGDTTILERLMIQQVGEQLVYLALPSGQSPAAFFLKDTSGGKWTFENAEHDFSQRIIYEKPANDGVLLARIEGMEKGESKTFAFDWKKVEKQDFKNSKNIEPEMEKKKKVTGIGGIFFKCQDPAKLREWYAENLGLVTNEYGSVFEFRNTDHPERKGFLQWSPFTEKTNYFEPSQKEFMINYRVENMESLVDELRAAGVTICDEIETYDYGKFVHIMDPEGNKIELWEPVDEVFEKFGDGKTTH